jgi:cell division septation protein DedD
MVLDYSERRQAAKVNKPRRQPVGLYSLLALALFGSAFALGVFTGWFLYRPGGRLAKLPLQPGQAVQSRPTAPVVPVPARNVPAPANSRAEVPLTFYETLPKGSKGLIGTGLNPKRDEATAKPGHAEGRLVAPPAPDAPPVSSQPGVKAAEKHVDAAKPTVTQRPDARTVPVKPSEAVKQAVPAKSSDQPAKTQATTKTAEQPIRFCVQIASHRDRKEADDERGRLEAKGIAAYVVESRVEGKGTWYRVRVGRHLSQKEAEGVAGRLGKGVMVIPD